MQYFMQNKSETGREVLQCVAILGGTLFYAAGMNLFVVPAGLYTGGIMGLAQLLRTLLIHLTGWTPKIDIAGLHFRFCTALFFSWKIETVLFFLEEKEKNGFKNSPSLRGAQTAPSW